MDQAKVGKFIAEKRKAKNLTQMQLAEMLNITDRAVSKWETGKSLPDSSIMLELCSILEISVTDLLCGEAVEMQNYDKETEKHLIEMVKQKEDADRKLLRMEILTGVVCIIPLLAAAVIVALIPMAEWIGTVIALTSLVPILVATPFMLRIEQTAGYYKCAKCGHVHVPKYSSVFMAMHYGRTRYMKCPECKKWSWQKKTISKE